MIRSAARVAGLAILGAGVSLLVVALAMMGWWR